MNYTWLYRGHDELKVFIWYDPYYLKALGLSILWNLLLQCFINFDYAKGAWVTYEVDFISNGNVWLYTWRVGEAFGFYVGFDYTLGALI